MDLGLSGKSALVTGATRGIGSAVAQALSAEGAKVAVGYHADADAAKALAAELGADAGRACVVRYSLAEPATADAAVARLNDAWGGIDVLVDCAIQRRGRRAPDTHFEDVRPADWAAPLTDDLTSTLVLCQAAIRSMRPRGWGRIVLISSHVVRNGSRGQEFYATGKSALHGLARSLAFDIGGDGMLINVVAPGLTSTEGVLEKLPEPLRAREAEAGATGRLSSPEEVAAMVTFLCSAANGNATGSVFTVAGGR